MAKFQVADIKFEFNYNFDKYFINNIEAYRIDDSICVEHFINVYIKDNIRFPKGNIIGDKNPYIILNVDKRIIFFKKSNEVSILIEHDYEYRNINIYLNKTITNDLEQTEYVMAGLMFMELSMHLNYLPIHATALSLNNEAILFCAPSGTGKSTHANFWKKLCPNVSIINDDKPLIKLEGNDLYVYGSFFSGEHKLNKNEKAKLKAIVLLRRGTNNLVEKADINEVIPEIIRNTLNPKLESSWNKVIPLIEKIFEEIPILKLYATNSEESIKSIYSYLYSK